MPGGAKIGNKNAFKNKKRSHAETLEYGRVYMQKRRALLKGDITQAQQFVGRPRKVKIKGDIFDVAAKLALAVKALVSITDRQEWPHTLKECEKALQIYHDFWEND